MISSYLIDTSVWINFIRDKDTDSVKVFYEILAKGYPYGITSVIYQEVLQGSNDIKDFNAIKEYLSLERFYYPKDAHLSYQNAANIFFQCQKKGITIRSAIDCLIAQIALENNLIIITEDKDFKRIQTVIPKLKLIK